MNPILGIVALIALIGCSREDKSAPLRTPKKSPASDFTPTENSAKHSPATPCPKDWADHLFAVDDSEVRLCHQEGEKQDGVYQNPGDRLALQVGDRFVHAEDKDFPNFQKKFRLPNFEGMHLKNFAIFHRRIFPGGASGPHAERFQSLLNYFREKNIHLDSALSVAETIPWLNEVSKPVTFEQVGPEEKMDALSIIGLLMGIKMEAGGFYGSHKDFIDTSLEKIRAGRLRLQKLTKLETKKVNDLTDLAGRERSAGYVKEKNVLLLGLPLDPSSLPSASNYIHELFHFYQDAIKLDSNFLEVEFSAYAKLGEFVVESLKSPSFRDRYQGAEDYLQKEFFQRDQTLDRPIAAGVLYAQALQDSKTAEVEKAQANLEELIHRYYYFMTFMKKNALESGKRAAQMASLIFTMPLSSAMEQFDTEIQKAEDEKTAAMKQLEKTLEGFKQENGNELSDPQIEELVKRFGEVLLLGAYTNELNSHKTELARMGGDIKPVQGIQMALDGPDYLKLYRELAKYQPLKYQRLRMDGIE